MNTSCQQPSVLPGTARNLEELERIMAQGLPHYEEIAFALREIHARRLYKNGYGTFKQYLDRRWQLSRSRGYQIIHYARLKLMSTTVDAARPLNERQARVLDALGQARHLREQDPILRAMNYIVATYERLAVPQRRELIHHLQELLKEMEAELKNEPEDGKSLPPKMSLGCARP